MAPSPTANKRKGSKWEIDIVDKARQYSIDAERLRLNGSEDEGDAVLRLGGKYYVVEAKATAKLEVSGYIAEAEIEAANFADHRGLSRSSVHPVVFWRRKGKPDPLDGVAFMTVREYLRLIKADAR